MNAGRWRLSLTLNSMCNQQGAIESRERVTPPSSAPKTSVLQAGGRADALAATLEATRAATVGKQEVTRSIPLPSAAIPEVRAAVEKAIAVPTAPAAPVEEGPAPVTLRIKMSELKGHQQRNLGRIMGDKLYLKGIGLITFKQENGELVVTLPEGKAVSASQMTSALQNQFNK